MKTVAGIFLLTLLMVLLLLLEHYTNIDIHISNNFYNFETRRWVVSYPEHMALRPFFYDGAKGFVAFIGTLCVLYLISAVWVKKHRKKMAPVLVLLLATILVPTVVGKLKKVTNVYCPNQSDVYEGPQPYVKIIEAYPEGFNPPHKGRCFPAGHVTGAFSLMALYLVFEDKRRKYIALFFAIAFGFITGGYQMLRGEHFISHNLFSMLLAGLIILVLNFIVTWGFKKFAPNLKQ